MSTIRLQYCNSEIGHAKMIGEDVAEITNIPYETNEVNHKDVVRVKKHDEFETFEVIEHIEQKTWTRRLLYEKGFWENVRDFFESEGITIEGAQDGFAALAVPMNIDIKGLYDIAKRCPVTVEVRPEPLHTLITKQA